MQSLDSFFSHLGEDAKELVPVSYRTMSAVMGDAPITRSAESTRYRSTRYDCFAFYKPISRVFKYQPPEKNAAGNSSLQRGRSDSPCNAERIFLLFACCVPVMGARRSSICDLQRGVFHLIPNGLAEILKKCRGRTVAAIKDTYNREYDLEIDEYFNFLIAHELGFWCDDAEAFPDLELSWDEPERITNALLDVDINSEHDFGSILRDLDDLGCKALQVRFYSGGTLPQLQELLKASNGTCLRSIDLVIPFHIEGTEQVYRQMCLDFPRISCIFVHSAPNDLVVRIDQQVSLIYRISVVDSPLCCGEINVAYFISNITSFSEAQDNNSCLNKKISIDARGEIRNCPSLPRSFGNIRDTSLHSALAQRDFKELWTINKDQVEVCRDCEFRYVCTDCRAYLTRPDDRFSKPAKCTYDPYSAQWG